MALSHDKITKVVDNEGQAFYVEDHLDDNAVKTQFGEVSSSAHLYAVSEDDFKFMELMS